MPAVPRRSALQSREERVRKVDLNDVLRRACRREPAALTTLVDLYSRRLFGLLYRLTGNRDAADDLLQETLLRLVRTIDRYEHSGRFEAWLFRIAANLARDHLRRRGRQPPITPLDGDDALGEPLAKGAAAAPDDSMIGAEARQRLADELKRLSEGEREVLLLRHYGELTFPEIAALLEAPLGTVLARAHRGLKHLRRLMDGES